MSTPPPAPPALIFTPPAIADPPPAPPAPPASPPTPTPTDPAADPADPADPALGPAGEKALAEWKKRAKDAEATAKAHAAKVKEYEDAQKSENELLADRATAAEAKAAAATRLAVAAKVEALATGRFTSAQDAVDALAGDADTFLADDGMVDPAAINAALTGLLERKPHWAAGASGPTRPQPDPSQGARPGGTPTLDQQIADAQATGDTKRSLALKTLKLRQAQSSAPQ